MPDCWQELANHRRMDVSAASSRYPQATFVNAGRAHEMCGPRFNRVIHYAHFADVE